MNAEKMLFQTQRNFIRAYTGLLVNMDIKFEAPLPEGPKILVANHPTTTDPFFLSLLSGEPILIPVTGYGVRSPNLRESLTLCRTYSGGSDQGQWPLRD